RRRPRSAARKHGRARPAAGHPARHVRALWHRASACARATRRRRTARTPAPRRGTGATGAGQAALPPRAVRASRFRRAHGRAAPRRRPRVAAPLNPSRSGVLMSVLFIHLLSRVPRRRGDAGQTTAEYALVLLGAAAVALVLVAWAAKSGKVTGLLDAVIDQITSKI